MSAVAAAASGRVPPPILSERLAAFFRDGDIDGVGEVSPYAACIVPILTALGWRPYSRELIDALPHFADHFELVDLLNVLVHLGFQSDPKRTRLDRVNDALLPCLFIGDGGRILVAVAREGDDLVCFDAAARETLHLAAPRLRGTAYVFTHLDESDALASAPTSTRAWFTRLLRRFRSIFAHLLVMTTFINLIALAMPMFILAVYDRVIGVGSADSLPWFVVGITIALGAELLLRYLRSTTLGLLAGRMDYLVGVETFRHLMSLPPVMTERASVSSQLARLRQFDAVRNFFAGASAVALLDLPFVAVFLLVMWAIAGPIVLVPLLMIAVYVVFAAFWLPGLNEQVAAAGAAKTVRQRRLMDTLTGIRELKALGAERLWRDTCREAVATSVTEDFRTGRAHTVVNAVANSTQSIAAVAVLGFGANAVIAGQMSVGMLIAVMTLLWRVLAPLQTLFLTYVKFDQTAQVIRQINALMRLEPEHGSARSALLIPKLQGAVSFDRVSFRYGPDKDPALLGVSLRVAPGEMTAVVGGNGCGKSTLLKLVMGMYHPQAGAVTIDRLDLRQFNAADLRRVVAYVPQQTSLFFGTIEQNLRLAEPGASAAQLERACAEAGILEIIENELEHGMATRVGDQSTHRLPSGLVHGLCMARAFLRAAPILLLDEPGSSLNQAADERLVTRLQELKGSRTIMMVSHRPSHIRLADKVITLDRGMLTGVGTPEQALEAWFAPPAGAQAKDRKPR